MTKTKVEGIENAVKRASSPSDLRITDMRLAVVASIYDYPIIRIDTNQGVYGIGEVRDAGHRENALQFKHMLIGKNPCDVDLIYRMMKQYGNWGREGGGVSGIEIALWDLVGKVYGVPCYQFLGGKYRDKVRIYADTPEPEDPTPKAFVKRVLGRKAQGLTFIKFDIRLSSLDEVEGSRIGRPTLYEHERGRARRAAGTGPVSTISDRGLARMEEIVAAVREAAGWETALCIDHFGHGQMTVKEVIRLGRRLEPYGLAWIEDPAPWWDIDSHKRVTDAIGVPIAAGEELYLWDGFREMIEKRAVDIIHPDLLTSGGLAETKRIGDYAERFNIPTALHFAGSPIAFMAAVHTAASLSSFVALEHHGLDMPFWNSLVTGPANPVMEEGYVTVPDAPGLGVDLNLEAIRENLRAPSGLFEPTDEWNTPKLGFWQPDDKWGR